MLVLEVLNGFHHGTEQDLDDPECRYHVRFVDLEDLKDTRSPGPDPNAGCSVFIPGLVQRPQLASTSWNTDKPHRRGTVIGAMIVFRTARADKLSRNFKVNTEGTPQ
jgi:hypothetical protein